MATTRSRDNRKREKPGRFGTDIAIVTANLISATATATTLQPLPTPYPPAAGDAYYLERISINFRTAASDADGTLIAKFQKVRGGSGGTIIDLTDTFSMESDFVTSTQTTFDIPVLSTLTQAQFAFIQGDALYLSMVSNSAAIDTQATAAIAVEFAVGA